MKKRQFAALLLSAALLASCGNPNDPGASNSADPIGESTSSQEPVTSDSSSKPITTYSIVDRTGDGVSITLSKTEAPKGETITITVTVAEGFLLNGLYVNGAEATKVNDTTYTFVMPDQSAVITSKLSVTGEAVVTGDVAARLERQQDGTFKGSVTANVSSRISVQVGSTLFGYGAVNLDRSFGDVGDASKDSFRISGNAVYEITFDASLGERPVIVKRTGFIHAPKSADDLATAFCGDYSGRNVNDGGTYNITNLKKATYRNTRGAISYVWNRYANNVSIATAKDLLTEEESLVYKKLTSTNYRVIDTYIETGRDSRGILFDDSMRNDTIMYSADYEVVENVSDVHYQVDSFKAMRDVITPSHNMHSIDRDMHYGYRTGFTVEDEVKAVGRVFEGVANSDGTFTTTVKSWKNYQDSNSTRSRSSYEISVTFNADSTVKEGSYKEYSYTDANWRFDDSDSANGGSAISGKNGTVIQSSSFSYEYGTSFDAAPAFDESPYFISSITSADVTSTGLATNHIQQNAIVDEWRDPQRESIESDSYGYTSLVNMTFAPSSALNRWQYGVVASSDMSVVGERVNGSYGFQALKLGETTLTIGGHTPGTASKTVAVTVENNVQPKSYYLMSALGYEDDFVSATSVQVTAGSSTAARLVINPVHANYNPTITVSNPNLKVTIDSDFDRTKDAYYTAKIIHIDATAMTNTSNETVKIYVADDFDPTYQSTPNFKVELDVIVKPRPAAGLWPTSLAGTTWTSNRALTENADTFYEDATIAFTNEDVTISNKTYKKAILNITSGQCQLSNYVMGYTYDSSKPSLSFAATAIAGYNYADVEAKVDASTGRFGFALTFVKFNGTEDLSYADAIGQVVSASDEEETGYSTSFVTFVRN